MTVLTHILAAIIGGTIGFIVAAVLTVNDKNNNDKE